MGRGESQVGGGGTIIKNDSEILSDKIYHSANNKQFFPHIFLSLLVLNGFIFLKRLEIFILPEKNVNMSSGY